MDDFSLVFIYTLGRIFIAMLLVGWIPAIIAKSKGRNFFGWWIYGGALFLIALIHSLVIKPITNQEGAEKQAGSIEDGIYTENEVIELREDEDTTCLYILQKDSEGEGLCRRCKNRAPRNELYYNKKLNTYYHFGCAPDKEKLRK